MSAADINRVVAIHATSFPASRSTQLGPAFLRYMYLWFQRYQPKLSFVALRDDEIVGFVTGTFGWNGGRKRFRFTVWQVIWGFIRRPGLLFSKDMFAMWSNSIRGLLPSTSQAPVHVPEIGVKVVLDSIAVHPTARGFKVAARLVAQFELAAKELGGTFITLGVEYNNQDARRLYERCDWHLVKESPIQNAVIYRKEIG